MRRLVCAFVLAACGDREAAPPATRSASKLELAIARDLTAKLGAAPEVRCRAMFGLCVATLPDRSTLAIRVRDHGAQWAWEIEGLVVDARPIEAYVGSVLADLGAAQGVACGARIRHLAPGARVVCTLAGGGKAFVTIARDGTMSLELAMDAGAARARTDDVVGLEKASRALEKTDDDDEEDEGARTDGGVESAP